jgi:hypothetical protein
MKKLDRNLTIAPWLHLKGLSTPLHDGRRAVVEFLRGIDTSPKASVNALEWCPLLSLSKPAPCLCNPPAVTRTQQPQLRLLKHSTLILGSPQADYKAMSLLIHPQPRNPKLYLLDGEQGLDSERGSDNKIRTH